MLVFQFIDLNSHHPPIGIFIQEPFDFADEEKKAIGLEISEEIVAPVIALQTLISMKQKANRPKDQLGIEVLRKVSNENL